MRMLARLSLPVVARAFGAAMVVLGALLLIAQGVDVAAVSWPSVAVIWALLIAVTLLPWSVVLRVDGRRLRRTTRWEWMGLVLSPLMWTGAFTAAFLQPRTGLVCAGGAVLALLVGTCARLVLARRGRREARGWLHDDLAASASR